MYLQPEKGTPWGGGGGASLHRPREYPSPGGSILISQRDEYSLSALGKKSFNTDYDITSLEKSLYKISSRCSDIIFRTI